jgi:SAM-dependent methyltransferase
MQGKPPADGLRAILSGMHVRLDVRRTNVIVAAAAVALLAAAAIGVAQNAGTHPLSGRQYALPMSVAGAAWLERPERIEEENPDLALRLMDVARGSTVADIGAGSGYFAIRLAKLVGPEGRVYATDIQPGMLTLLRANVAGSGVKNVIPVLGGMDDPKLPRDSIDLALMVDVYHEFSEPQKMLQRIRDSLKPAGRLVLLEYRAEDPAVPILPSHKMTIAQAKLEVEHEGFALARVLHDLPRQHLLIFTRR